MEAAASGLPVIMRRIPETDQIYPDHLFPKVDDESPEGLAELIRHDLESGTDVIERADAARKFVESEFGLDVFLPKVDAILREAASKSAK